jgi:Fe-S-cluster containining protein
MPTDWCKDCGHCCRNQTCPPFCGEDENLPQELREEINAWLDSPEWSDDAPCLWLTPDNRCKHYDLRPDICRDYEVGDEACRNERMRNGLTINGMPLPSPATGEKGGE